MGIKPKIPGDQTGQDLTLCGASAPSTKPDPSNCAKDQAGNIGLKGGALFTATAIKATKKTADLEADYNDPTTAGAVPSAATLKAELSLVKGLEVATARLRQVSTSIDAKQIATSSKLKQAVAKALGGEKGSYKDTETKTKADHFLKQTVGMDGEKAENDLVKELSQLAPPKEAVGGDGTRKLQDISAPQDLANAITLYAVRRFVAEEQKKKNQASPSCPTKTEKAAESPKTADECKKHTTSEDCKKEKCCEFDDKKPEREKCLPKENSSTTSI
ncbi:uncharacterized protein TEOVI_000828600 [Trypanosoma equiperdum]|uniref:Variant surface glycoprotein 1125 n=1 Tax=Trypanosoma equiperdum TaxID=5694 RepID=A0A1G4I5X1_TRYEQ|nr:hypothetical protein, conserved [Trypanosoma equiperdum]